MSRFIVAEICRNWGENTDTDDLISKRFEFVINTNFERGYKLVTWQLTTSLPHGVLVETIVAVFELIKP